MATTNHLGIVLIEQSQAQKEVTANEAFARIDAVLNCGFIDHTLASPPLSPAEGDVYLVAASASGEWLGKDGQIAYFDGGIWRFIAPREGVRLWSEPENRDYIYDGSAWIAESNRELGYDQAQYQILKTLTEAPSISWDVRYSTHAQVTLTANRALAAPTGAQAGGIYRLIVRQDAAGGHSLSFDAAYAFAGGSAPSVSGGANAVDVLSFLYDGTQMLCLGVQGNLS